MVDIKITKPVLKREHKNKIIGNSFGYLIIKSFLVIFEEYFFLVIARSKNKRLKTIYIKP